MRMPGYASGQVLGWALLLSAAGCASPRVGAGGASPSPVVGAWRVQSIEQVLKDGTRRGDWMGPRPAGLVIFDPSGAFSLQYGRGSAKRTWQRCCASTPARRARSWPGRMQASRTERQGTPGPPLNGRRKGSSPR